MSLNDTRPRAARFGALGFAAVAFGCAAFAAFLVGKLLQHKGYTGERTRPVVVAKRAIAAAEPLTKDVLEVMNWPEASVQPGSVGDIAKLFESGKTLIPTTGIQKGEPIVPSRLASAAAGTGLAALVEPGFRAVAVRVDAAVGRAKLVYPGAHVDVLSTIRSRGFDTSTRIVVENVRVLAVEADTDVVNRKRSKDDKENNSGDETVVTLEVTPQDAEVLGLTSREGKLDLALRNAADRTPVATRGVTPAALAASSTREEKPKDVAPPPARLAAAEEPKKPVRVNPIQLRRVAAPRSDVDSDSGSRIEMHHAR